MKLGYVRGSNVTQQLNILEEVAVEELFSDDDLEFSSLMDERSELMQLIHTSEPEDIVYIAGLDTISRNYGELKEFVHILDEFELTLVVVDLPSLTNQEWLALFHWCQRNERIVHPRLLKMGKEKQRNANSYSFMTKDPQAKKLYWETIWALVAKKPIKKIAKEKRIPIETVFRIKKELEKIRLAALLVICFLLAIFSIKVTEVYFDSIWIQITICIGMTLIILWNVLVDTSGGAKGKRW